MDKKIICTLLLSLTVLHNATRVLCQSHQDSILGHQTLHAASEQARAKRKVSELDSNSAGALEYMTKLREQMTDSEGRPLFSDNNDPTSIWCILDKDMLKKAYRPRPRTQTRCTALNKFVFNMESVTSSDDASQQVDKAYIRTYLKPIARLLRQGPANVDISIAVGIAGEDYTVIAGEDQVEVTMSSSWMELDVTRGIQALWPLARTNSDLEVTITLTVDCKDTKKVPAIFIDPTEIDLSNSKRRERYSQFQPFLLMFFDDSHIKEQAKNGTIPMDSEIAEFEDENTESSQRAKRSTSSCGVEDYSVVFHDLHLYTILLPAMYNARVCSGSCSHSVLTGNHKLGTNHANIMAGAYSIDSRNGAKEPCCSPTRYSSLVLILATPTGIVDRVFPAMAVEECGCR